MNRALCLVAALSLSSLAACEQAAVPAAAGRTAVDLTGHWQNERGSVLVVDSVVDGVLKGTFTSTVGKANSKVAYPITGFVNGDVVGFVVNFGESGSVATFAGQLADEGLRTQWHVSRDVADADEPKQLWSSVLTGSDTFTKR